MKLMKIELFYTNTSIKSMTWIHDMRKLWWKKKNIHTLQDFTLVLPDYVPLVAELISNNSNFEIVIFQNSPKNIPPL